MTVTTADPFAGVPQDPDADRLYREGLAAHYRDQLTAGAGTRAAELRRRAAAIRNGIPREAQPAAEPSWPEGAITAQPAAERAAVAVREPAAVARREDIDGDQVLRYVFTFLKRFAVWGSDAEIVAATLWIAQAHARDGDGAPVWDYCARLGIFGPSGSGKSWKCRLIGKLAPAGETLLEPTKPSLIDLIADNHVIVLTEADELFGTTGRNRGILATVNAGYERDRCATRKHGGKVVKVPVFGHVVLDGTDELLKAARTDLRTMLSRCIVLLARRAPDGYRPPRFDATARAAAEMISKRLGAWLAQEVATGLADEVPDVPEHLGNRPYALWCPMFSVALRADKGDPQGPWSAACAAACEQLEDGAGLPQQTDEDMSELDRIMEGYGA